MLMPPQTGIFLPLKISKICTSENFISCKHHNASDSNLGFAARRPAQASI